LVVPICRHLQSLGAGDLVESTGLDVSMNGSQEVRHCLQAKLPEGSLNPGVALTRCPFDGFQHAAVHR
jgi:hypothetical protein